MGLTNYLDLSCMFQKSTQIEHVVIVRRLVDMQENPYSRKETKAYLDFSVLRNKPLVPISYRTLMKRLSIAF